MSEDKSKSADASKPSDDAAATPVAAAAKTSSGGWKGNLGFALAFLIMLGGGYFVGQWAIDYFRPVELEEGDRYAVKLRGNEPQMGDDGALVTIVEFSDFECPFCAKAAQPLIDAVEAYDADEVRLIFKHYPLPFHRLATPAARAAWAAHQQGKFWPFAEWLFEVGGDFEGFPAKLEELGMDKAKFIADMEGPASLEDVDDDMAAGGMVGVSGTPAFVINGHIYSGARPESFWRKAIDHELKIAEALVDDEGIAPTEVYARLMAKADTQRGDGNPVGKKPSERQPREQTAGRPNPMVVYSVPVEGRPQIGPDDALVTIVEFADYHCPFCQRVVPTMDALVEKFPGDVRVVYRQMPLPIHPDAQKASLAALAAGKQGKFWEAHRVIFETRAKDEEGFRALAAEIGIDADKLLADMEDPELVAQVEADKALARKLGVRGTPAFFINGRFLSGAQPMAKFSDMIEREIEKAKTRLATGISRDKVYATILEEGEPEVSG